MKYKGRPKSTNIEDNRKKGGPMRGSHWVNVDKQLANMGVYPYVDGKQMSWKRKTYIYNRKGR